MQEIDAAWENEYMGFDENPPSPDKMVDVSKPDTKVNLAVAAGVVVFLLIGLGFLVYFAVTRAP
jgi:hypothetical protein